MCTSALDVMESSRYYVEPMTKRTIRKAEAIRAVLAELVQPIQVNPDQPGAVGTVLLPHQYEDEV